MEEEECGVGSKGEIQENAKVEADNNKRATQISNCWLQVESIL